jgi:hypothetical protein
MTTEDCEAYSDRHWPKKLHPKPLKVLAGTPMLANSFAYKTPASSPQCPWFDAAPELPVSSPIEVEQLVSGIFAAYSSNLLEDLPDIYEDHSAMIEGREDLTMPESIFEPDLLDIIFTCLEPPFLETLGELALPIIRFFYTRNLKTDITCLLERNLLQILLDGLAMFVQFSDFVIQAVKVVGDIARRNRELRDYALTIFTVDICMELAERDEETAALMVGLFWAFTLYVPLERLDVERLLEVTARVLPEFLTDGAAIQDPSTVIQCLVVFHQCSGLSYFSRWMHDHAIDTQLHFLLLRMKEDHHRRMTNVIYWILSVFVDLVVTDSDYVPCFVLSVVLDFVIHLGDESDPVAIGVNLRICQLIEQFLIREHHSDMYAVVKNSGMHQLLLDMFQFSSFELRCQIVEVWRVLLAGRAERLDEFLDNHFLTEIVRLLDCGVSSTIVPVFQLILSLIDLFQGVGRDVNEISEQMTASTGIEALLDLCMDDDEEVAIGAVSVCEALGIYPLEEIE